MLSGIFNNTKSLSGINSTYLNISNLYSITSNIDSNISNILPDVIALEYSNITINNNISALQRSNTNIYSQLGTANLTSLSANVLALQNANNATNVSIVSLQNANLTNTANIAKLVTANTNAYSLITGLINGNTASNTSVVGLQNANLTNTANIANLVIANINAYSLITGLINGNIASNTSIVALTLTTSNQGANILALTLTTSNQGANILALQNSNVTINNNIANITASGITTTIGNSNLVIQGNIICNNIVPSTSSTPLNLLTTGALIFGGSEMRFQNSTSARILLSNFLQMISSGQTAYYYNSASAKTGIGGITSPNYTLDVNGDTNILSSSSYRIGGNIIVNSTTISNITSNITTLQSQTQLLTSNSTLSTISGNLYITQNANTQSLTAVTANITTANTQSLTAVTANITTANITTANITTANIATANTQSLTAVIANITTANIITANIKTANTQSLTAVTANIVTENISGNLYVSQNAFISGNIGIGTTGINLIYSSNNFVVNISGNVGVNNLTPSFKFHTSNGAVCGDYGLIAENWITPTNLSQGTYIGWNKSGGSAEVNIVSVCPTGYGSTAGIEFGNYINATSTYTSFGGFYPSGLGIGTTSPSTKLYCNGTATINNNLTVNGYLINNRLYFGAQINNGGSFSYTSGNVSASQGFLQDGTGSGTAGSGQITLPLSAYYTLHFSGRINDTGSTMGFIPYYSYGTNKYLFGSSDGTIWIPTDGSNRRCYSWTTVRYLSSGTIIFGQFTGSCTVPYYEIAVALNGLQ